MLGANDPLLDALLGPVGGASFPVAGQSAARPSGMIVEDFQPTGQGFARPAPNTAPAPQGAPQDWDWSSYLVDGGTRPDAISGLADPFEAQLASLFASAPPEVRQDLRIMSGYRSIERQTQLWEDALKKYGSAEAADNWVAPPGNSQHNHGSAADLRYLDDDARRWVHENAGRFGLHFPLDNEPWHIEPLGARDGGGGATMARGPAATDHADHAGHVPGDTPPGGPQGADATGLAALFAPPANAARQEAAIGLANRGVELSTQADNPLLAFLAPIASAFATKRATGARAPVGLDPALASQLDARGQAALRVLNDPNASDWQKDLAEDILADQVNPSASASSQRLTGQIEGADGILYGQNADGELEAYTAPDGTPIPVPAPTERQGPITWEDAPEATARAHGYTSGQISSTGQFRGTGQQIDRDGNPTGGDSDPVTWEPMTPEEARSHGWTSGQKSSRGQVQRTGRLLTASELAATAAPLSSATPEPSLPSDPSGYTPTAAEQALLDKYR